MTKEYIVRIKSHACGHKFIIEINFDILVKLF